MMTACWIRQAPFFGIGLSGLLALLFVVYNAGTASRSTRVGAASKSQEEGAGSVPSVQSAKEPSPVVTPASIPPVAAKMETGHAGPLIKAVDLKPIRPLQPDLEDYKIPKINWDKYKVPEYKPVTLARMPEAPQPVALAKVPAFDPEATRPSSGTMLTSPLEASARGVFTATNGSDEDAAVFLAPIGEHKASVAFYVRADGEYKAEGIPDGTYDVFVRMGHDWHETTQSFANGETLTRFEDSFAFETRTDGSVIHSKHWTVTLHPVIGGNAKSRRVSASDFPTASKVRHQEG